MLTPLHGGPDAMGVPRHDLSSNGNPCGAWPAALQALQHADARHYPDPAYTALRRQLGAWHGVATDRIVLAASASEFIQRISLAVALTAGPEAAVWQPAHAYGDYARAAQAAGLPMTGGVTGRALDFLVQEMGREINTIGSKANDGEITRRVVAGKTELERFREQVQNIE